MAPLGISLVNLLIESSSSTLSYLAEDGQAKKQEFAQNSSSSVSLFCEPSTTSLTNTANPDFHLPPPPSSSSPTSASFKTTTSSFPSADRTNLNNNNNYFGGTSVKENGTRSGETGCKNIFEPAELSSTQNLYSAFWEKFKKPYGQEEVNSSCPFAETGGAEQVANGKNIGKDFKNSAESAVRFDDKTASSFSETYKKFYEGAQKINRQLLPFWCLLSYPSDLHYYGRVAVMTVVTGLVIEKSLEKLPDIEQLEKRYGPYLQCNLLDGTDPTQPGRVGLDKDFLWETKKKMRSRCIKKGKVEYE